MNKALIKAFIEAGCEQQLCWLEYTKDKKDDADGSPDAVMLEREDALKEFYCGPVEINYSVMGDDNYFSVLRDLDYPPVVVETVGLFYKFITSKLPAVLVNTETLFEKLTKMAVKEQFKLMYIFKDESTKNYSHIKCLTPESKDMGDYSMSDWFESYSECCTHAAQLANVIIFDDGVDDAFVSCADFYAKNRELLAIPGNTGCYANQLIKSKRWTLCDSGTDIAEAVERARKTREE